MTLDQLEQYTNLRAEVAELERKQERAERRARVILTDSVRGSDPEYPYCPHTIIIRGRGERQARTVRKIKMERRKRLEKAKGQLAEIEAFIASVDDSRIRRIIDLRYIQGKNWKQVAQKIYGSPHYEDAAKKRLYRYLDCPKSPELKC